MANFNDSNRNSQQFGLFGELNIDGINSMNANSSKEMPPLNPLAVTSGIYIPPEETQQHHDDAMHWGLSDDQNDSDDDDMDGNEFDLDFDDAEVLPPLNYDTQQNTNNQIPDTTYLAYPQQPSCASASPYMMNQFQTPFSSRYNMSPSQYDAQPIDNDNLLYSQPSHTPPQFINPSNLQLPQEEQQLDYLNSMNSIDSMNNPGGIGSSQYGGGLDIDDMNLDLEFDDLYPMYRNENTPLGDQHQLTTPEPVSNNEPFTTPPAEAPLDQQYRNSYPQQNAFDTYLSPEPQAEQEQPQQPQEQQRMPSPPTEAVSLPSPVESPVEKKTQSRRKTRPAQAVSSDDEEYDNSPPSRRKGRKVPQQASTSSSHVCNKVYPDGTECHRSFTRPYDLARHQETLHAPVRKTFKCQVCGNDSKTFSRLDALSRHMRLKHPSE